jgi:adenine-specific DNA-methyltransferase
MSSQLELERLRVQAEIDSAKPSDERNKLGQFATPPKLAVQILAHAKKLLKNERTIKFLDPAIGTGSFYSALLETFEADQISEARGFEIDPSFAKAAMALWKPSGLNVTQKDFTVQPPTPDFNLIISNPPYVRHHHLTMECKNRLRNTVYQELGLEVSGLTGLYCYFMLLCHHWMADDGIAGWLIPSEFMDVNYGSEIKRYLMQHVELLQIHRFDPTEAQFHDALVSSAIVWFRKRAPSKNHKIRFTYGGTLDAPKAERTIAANSLACDAKWTRYSKEDVVTLNSSETRLGDFLSIRRGLATGDNRFFILTRERIRELGLPSACFRPILPPPRQLKEMEVFADDTGVPLLDEQSFLLDTTLPMEAIEKRYPKLAIYLKDGHEASKGYLCAHRDPWYSQERRDAAPLLCTYMGRGTITGKNPFRFILNHSKATATNVYLMLYPKPELATRLKADSALLKKIWKKLNSIPHEVLVGEGRVYGGGLYKLEPKELANVPLCF